MSITLNDLLGYWPYISTFGPLALVVLIWRLRGEFATKADLAKLSDKVDGLSTQSTGTGMRVESLEREMQLLPTRADIHSLQIVVTEIKGSLNEMRAEARGDRDLLGRLDAALVRHEDIIAATGRNNGGRG